MTQKELKQRLIELVKASLFRHIDKSCLLAENIVNDLLSNGVTIRERGEWEKKTLFPIHYDCSVCGLSVDYKKSFCPHCGADMRGVKDA